MFVVREPARIPGIAPCRSICMGEVKHPTIIIWQPYVVLPRSLDLPLTKSSKVIKLCKGRSSGLLRACAPSQPIILSNTRRARLHSLILFVLLEVSGIRHSLLRGVLTNRGEVLFKAYGNGTAQDFHLIPF